MSLISSELSPTNLLSSNLYPKVSKIDLSFHPTNLFQIVIFFVNTYNLKYKYYSAYSKFVIQLIYLSTKTLPSTP